MPNLTITSYAQAEQALATAKNKVAGKPLATGTRLMYRVLEGKAALAAGGDALAVQYHETDVVTFHRNGDIVLNTGGWLTMTTRARMEEYLPAGYRLASVKGRWFLMTYEHTATGSGSFAFRDGLVIHQNGTISGYEPASIVAVQDAENKVTDKAVKAYVAALDGDTVQTSLDNAGGDCFACLAPESFDVSHLALHVAEGYYPARLLAKVLSDKGYQPGVYLGMAARGDEWALRAVRKHLAGYLRNALYAGAVAVAHGRKPVGAVKDVWQRGA